MFPAFIFKMYFAFGRFLLSVEAILGYAQEISVESQLLLSSDIVKMRISSHQPSKPVT